MLLRFEIRGDCDRKSRPNFGLFRPVKLRRGVGEMSESLSSTQDSISDLFLLGCHCAGLEISGLVFKKTVVEHITSRLQAGGLIMTLMCATQIQRSGHRKHVRIHRATDLVG